MTLLIAEGPSFWFHLIVPGGRQDAIRHFRKAWKIHVKQTGADADYENAVTVNVIENIRAGTVYRDYMALEP